MRRFLQSALLLTLAVPLCACPPSREPTDDDDSTTAEPVCEGAAPLDAVCIELAPTATFTVDEAAAGISIPYVLRIEDTIEGVTALAQDAGGCGRPDASGLLLFERLEGEGQGYCECDIGICPAPTPDEVTLVPGEWPRSFEWQGRNWAGPSDTGNPPGAPFPPGEYTLTVRAIGQVQGEDYEVLGSLALTLQ